LLTTASIKLTAGAGAGKVLVSDASGNGTWTTLASAGVSSLNSLTGALSITAGTGVTVTPSSPNVQISIGQAVGTAATPTFASMTLSGGAGTRALYIQAGYTESVGGFYTGGTNTDIIKADAGGVTAKWLIGTESASITGSTSPTLSASGQIRLGVSGGRLVLSENAGSYVFVYTQNLAATASPTFAGLTVNGAIQTQGSAYSGNCLYIGNDTVLVDIDWANVCGLYGSTPTEGGVRLGSSGNYLYGKSGGIGVGTNSPSYTFHVNGSVGGTSFNSSGGVTAQSYTVGYYAGGTMTGQTLLYAASLTTATVYLRTVSGDLQWYTTSTGVWQSVGAGGIGLLNYASLSTSGVVLNFRSGLYTAI
jgi:hypothetical protein